MVTFVIGKAVPLEKVPKDMYVVETSQMSGDADAYASNGFQFHDRDEAEKFAEFCLAIEDIMSSGYVRDRDRIAELLKEKVSEDVIKAAVGEYGYIEDLIMDICGWDVTCEDMLATLDGVTVYYYDENGVKYDVAVNK